MCSVDSPSAAVFSEDITGPGSVKKSDKGRMRWRTGEEPGGVMASRKSWRIDIIYEVI